MDILYKSQTLNQKELKKLPSDPKIAPKEWVWLAKYPFTTISFAHL